VKFPLFVRPLSPEERRVLEKGLRSPDGFVVRRCQALLKSAEGYTPRQIQRLLGVSDQSVRNAIRAFAAEGLDCLKAKSSRPKSARKLISEEQLERLKTLLHQKPRDFGVPRSDWTLESAARVCWEEGITDRQVSDETIRDAMKRLGVGWQRAKRWITSADPEYARKKGRAIG
jgi:transposase